MAFKHISGSSPSDTLTTLVLAISRQKFDKDFISPGLLSSIHKDFTLHFQRRFIVIKVGGLPMSRPLLLVSLLLLMVFTSQFEWNQHIVNEVEARPLALSQKQQYILEREESIILSQEKHIQKLKTLVQNLQEQLLACRGKDEYVNDTTGSLTEPLNGLNHQQIM
ncbi:hypothetical protein Ccrd_024300, partial [Cynara cardunculus var. scolymus]